MKKIIQHMPVIAFLFSLVFTLPAHAGPKPKRQRPDPTVDLNIPSENMTNDQLFLLHGIDGIAYTPPQGVPTIVLESPEKGTKRVRSGDPIIIEGHIDDAWITQAKLLLNGVPITLSVKEGPFKRKIFLPETRVTTFRIMATGSNGRTGYGSLHTVLIGEDIDIGKPRFYWPKQHDLEE